MNKIFHLEIVVETRGRGERNTGSAGATGAVGSTFCTFVNCGIDLTALSWLITSRGGGSGLVRGPPTGSQLHK